MEEALELFGEIANSKWLRPGADDISFILFLNKVRKEAKLIHTCPYVDIPYTGLCRHAAL